MLTAGASLVAIATGATWRDDGVGRHQSEPIAGLDDVAVFTPDDIMDGRLPSGRVVLFDDDHYYMGGVIAELLVAHGCNVTFVTPQSLTSAFTQHTAEQGRIQRRLSESCATIVLLATLARVEPGSAHVSCVYPGRETQFAADAIVLVTGTIARDELYRELRPREEALAAAGIRRIVRVGDCLGPGIIAAAVYSGHLFARTLDTALTDWTPFRRESVELAFDQPLPPSSRAHLEPRLALGSEGRRE